MRLSTLISCLYGEMRGYRRWSVRRQVAANERQTREAVAKRSRELFGRRVYESVARFPLYAETVKKHRGALPKEGEPIDPNQVPIWTRRDQREFFKQQERPADSAYVHQTSGSTGTPIYFHVTREAYEWHTAVSDRGYSWAGAEEGIKSLYLWAAEQVPPPLSARIKRAVHSALQRRTYFDVYRQVGEKEMEQCCRAINKTRPSAIVGYSSMLVTLARFAREHPGLLKWKARTLINAAEGLQPGQRELFEAFLADEVYLAYGSREFMMIGMECAKHRGYHVAADSLMVEVVDGEGQPVEPGAQGRIVITDFFNAATPFIRYEIGDWGTMAPAGEECPCGLPFPLLTSVDGRLQDVIYTAEGTKITGLYVTFTMRQFDWIEGYQVVQDTKGKILVRLLTTAELTPEKTARVTDLLRKRLGQSMQVTYERVDELTRRDGGKVHLVMSSIKE